MLRLPSLIDVHVHMREPGAPHKEDWFTGTAAALAGGITTILAMPNTNPAICNDQTLEKTLNIAKKQALCDFGQYLGAGIANSSEATNLNEKVAGLKMYLDATYGDLKLDGVDLWEAHIKNWEGDYPICIHAEIEAMKKVIEITEKYEKNIHICHVSTKEEIELIKDAKDRGILVTCEVTPHHLFLSDSDLHRIGTGRCEVRPPLTTLENQQALWENLDVIDCFATDHAPHTLGEKDGQKPPPGFPGLETALPLLLTAVSDGKLSIEDIIERMHINPSKIFKIPVSAETYIDVDLNQEWTIRGEEQFTKCAWTPFEGRKVKGKVEKVVIRGEKVFENGKILVKPSFGKNIREI